MKEKLSGELNSVSSRNSTNYTENADWLNVLRDPKEAQINYTLPLPVEKEGDNLIISNLIIVQSRNTDNLNYAVVKITYKDDATIYTIHDLEEKYNYTSQSNAQNETGRIIGDCYEIMFEIPWSIEVGGTVVHGSDIHTELICNDGGGTSGSTGESGGGETFPKLTGAEPDGTEGIDLSISIVGNPTVEDALEAHNWEKQIEDSQLEPCMQSIMTDLKNLNKGVGEIIQKFAGDLDGYNWEVKEGKLSQGTGMTLTRYNNSTGTTTSIFDSKSWPNASDLSWARTILHEAVHAKLVAHYNVDRPDFLGTYTDMVQDWNTYQNWEIVHHEEFARSLIKGITDALKEFGIQRGYSHHRQFYQDMSWAGLQETEIFKKLPSAVRERILNVNSIELTGKDLSQISQTQKGTDAGC
ncbi:hypothetical protein QYS48_26295 [Marivirga arenosa]|uniref:Uncharacterized protein n=1 Tax=Marivirga arenosa TaxID=3059076 RepID=A0AA49GE26_9BACT|nr:hypothetical protein [Marivirga sp. ABR2-2]WKK85392.2 hypothetical protein QYS48_26295 [Marivirga sp. ABR2-2]